ncbi:MAG TPA: F0F1 ATP synthase subunit gamma, partial [Alphaproteobacteria bacterium]|nr:F0F1 ATP synthase subunit gamma [Alphaproteobacteria bacterium]
PDEAFALPGSVNGLVQTAQAVLVQADRWRHEKGAAHIRVFFNRRIGDTLARPTSRTLTPLSQAYLDRLTDRSWPTRRLPTFSMDADALFSWLVRQHLFISLYRAGAESMASEHASRLAAMQAAERNINDRLDELTAQYRKKRQESITTELMDIVSGFEAMAGAEDTTSPDQ